MMSLLGQGVLTVVGNPGILLAMFVGVFIGIIFGALPGLTTVACLSMFLPVTYVMSQEMGLSMLTAIYIGGMSGGLVSAILLNIPGTPSSIATCFDGTPMAKKGLAGKALGTGVFASIVGNFIGVLAMIFISPPLAAATLQFGPWENFGVTLFALTLIASLCGKNIYTGLLSAVFGMMFSTIGLDKIDSSQRFTFGFNSLTTGFGLLTVLVGMYAVSEVLKTASSDQQEGKVNEDFHMHGLGLTGTEIKSQSWNLLRSSLIGLAIGILPGIGGSTANIIAYSVAKSSSKYPEKFGTGIIDGICASESANNASVGGAMIPLLTLGIPGDGSTALLLGGFMLHGLQPGPLLFQNNRLFHFRIHVDFHRDDGRHHVPVHEGFRKDSESSFIHPDSLHHRPLLDWRVYLELPNLRYLGPAVLRHRWSWDGNCEGSASSVHSWFHSWVRFRGESQDWTPVCR